MDTKEIQFKIAQMSIRFNRKERFRIYRKLGGMLAMNESLGRSLERLWYNVSEMGKKPNKPIAVALRDWLNKDRMGITLSEAMAGWIPVNELFMIRAGEESGAVAQSFKVILDMGDKGKAMKEAISQAITYPLFMMVLIGAVLWMFGVNMIAPMKQFAPPQVMASMSGLVMTSDFVQSYGILVVIGIIGAVGGLAFSMPIWLGEIRIKFDMFPPWSWYRVWQGSAFLLSLSALLAASVPLKRALEVLESQSSPWLKERIYATRQEVMRGRNLGESLRAIGMNFPDPQVALDMEILAERADVAETMQAIADEWMDEQIAKLQVQSQFVRFAGMGVVGGIIAWAMLSIVNVSTEMSNGGIQQ